MMAVSRMYLNTQPLLPLSQPINGRPQSTPTAGLPDFGAILQKTQQTVCFSRHAADRLHERKIQLSDEDLSRLNDTVDRLAQKGARESLIYMKNVALIVSVTNRTVITAMDGTSGKDNIITNIDSAAII